MLDDSIKKSKKPSVSKVATQINKDSRRIAKKQKVSVRSIQDKLISNVNAFVENNIFIINGTFKERSKKNNKTIKKRILILKL